MAYINVGHSISHLVMLLYPTIVLALEPAWGIGFATLLPLGFAGYLLFGLAALPAGWLGDRWDSEKMMVIFFLGTGSACILAGFATGPVSMAAALTLIGLFACDLSPRGSRLGGGRQRAAGARTWHQRRLRRYRHGECRPSRRNARRHVVHWRAAFILPGIDHRHRFRPVLRLADLRRGKRLDDPRQSIGRTQHRSMRTKAAPSAG